MGAYARIRIGRSRKVVTKYSSVFLLKNGGHKTIKIGLDEKTVGKLRSALAHHQKVIATIFGAILDPSGNIESRRAARSCGSGENPPAGGARCRRSSREASAAGALEA